MTKLNENLDNNLSIVLLRLALLVDEDVLHVSVLAALLLDLLLQLVVQLLGADHVLEAEDSALPHAPGSYEFLHDEFPGGLTLDLDVLLLAEGHVLVLSSLGLVQLPLQLRLSVLESG